MIVSVAWTDPATRRPPGAPLSGSMGVAGMGRVWRPSLANYDTATAAGTVLSMPLALVGEGTRYVVGKGVDVVGRAVTYLWDTSAGAVADAVYGEPSIDVPVTAPPVLPSMLERSGPRDIGGEADPRAVDRLVTESWQIQQGAWSDFFGREADRGGGISTGWLYLLLAGGVVAALILSRR